MRLVAAMGNRCQPVITFMHRTGLPKGRVRIACRLVRRRLYSIACLVYFFFFHQMRQDLVFHLHSGHCVAGDLFGIGCQSNDFRADPLNLRAHAVEHLNGSNTRYLFSRAGVEFRNAGMRMRGADDLGNEHPLGITVIGVFRAPGDFVGAIRTAYSFSNQAAVGRGRPIVFSRHVALLAVRGRHPRPPGGHRRRCRNGKYFHSTPVRHRPSLG